MEKHADVYHAGYVADMTELIERVILNECYISKYVADYENKEANHVEGLKVVLVQYEVTNPLKQTPTECYPSRVHGTLYLIRAKESSNENDNIILFVPREIVYHCQSNYYVHTAFWIRGRYIQRALVINSCLRNHTDTIHKQWDIRGHPLFNEVRENFAN